MQNRLAVIFDNFDETAKQKNIGTFIAYAVQKNVPVDIITNETKWNKSITFDSPYISLIRLKGKNTWPPLDTQVLFDYFHSHVNSYSYLWLYRGRTYTAKIMNYANEKNLTTLLKLDSDDTLSITGKLFFRIFSLIPISYTKKVHFFRKAFRKLPLFFPFRGFYEYDFPLLLTSLIICETPKSKQFLQNYFSKEKLFVYPNSIFVKEKQVFSKKKNIILSVGRIVWQKGFENGIIAFSKLPDNIKRNWRYEIVGPVYDQQYKKKLDTLIKSLHLEKYVDITEGLYAKHLEKKYNESSIFFMPYPRKKDSHGLEGQPNVVVEAMYYKNAVLTTNVGSVAYLIGASGVLAEYPEDMSEKLLALIKNKKKRILLGKNAHSRVVKYFNIEKNAFNLYKKMKDHDYKIYFDDQAKDSIVGGSIQHKIYKYCDLLTSELLYNKNFTKMKILDIGCREFFTYNYFLEKYRNKIQGIDIGEKGLEFTKGKKVLPIDIHKMDTYFKPRTFDLLLSIHVFEHMYDLDKALQQCFKILKKDGYLFFAIPMPSIATRRGHWARIESKTAMEKKCRENGFSVVFSKVYPAHTYRDEKEMIALVTCQ